MFASPIEVSQYVAAGGSSTVTSTRIACLAAVPTAGRAASRASTWWRGSASSRRRARRSDRRRQALSQEIGQIPAAPDVKEKFSAQRSRTRSADQFDRFRARERRTVGAGGESLRREARLSQTSRRDRLHRASQHLWYCADQQRLMTRSGRSASRTSRDAAARRSSVRTASPSAAPTRRARFARRRVRPSHRAYPAHQVPQWQRARISRRTRSSDEDVAEAGYDCGLVGKLSAANIDVRGPLPTTAIAHSGGATIPHPMRRGARLRDVAAPRGGTTIALLNRSTTSVPGSAGRGCTRPVVQSEMAIRFVTEQRDGPWLPVGQSVRSGIAPFDAPPEYLARVRCDGFRWAAAFSAGPTFARQKAFAAIDQQRPKGRGGPAHPQVDRRVAAGRSRRHQRRGPARDYDASGGQGQLLRDDHADR